MRPSAIRTPLSWLVLSFSLLAYNAQAQITCSTANAVGYPSADETDRTYLNLISPAVGSPYRETSITLGIPSDATIFDIEIFDGDDQTTSPINASGDRDIPLATPYQYQVIADPQRDGSGSVVISDTSDADHLDNQWSLMVDDRAPDSAAQAFSGYYFYRINFAYTGDTVNDFVLNAFKVRACSDSATALQMSTREFSFFPWAHFGSGESNSSVGFALYPYAAEGLTSLDLTDGDADSSVDASNPGTGFGNPGYSLVDPMNNPLLVNLDTSGENEFETTNFAPAGGAPSGSYLWTWFGLNINNTVIMSANVDIFSTPVAPFPVGTAPPTTPGSPAPVPLAPLWWVLIAASLTVVGWRAKARINS